MKVPQQQNPVVKIDTSLGVMTAELWSDKAPKTVANFLRYADEGFYNGTIFHRVIPGFMIQGGGFDAKMQEKDTHEPIENEASPSVGNNRGTLAMARTGDPHSATSQFFINLKDNDFLNQTDKTTRGYGYCVFGKLTSGYDVLDKIAQAPTGSRPPHDDVPVQPIVIKSVSRLKP